jgi:hypothetical protein
VPSVVCVLTGKRQILKKHVRRVFYFMIGISAGQTSEILNLASGEKAMSRFETFD